MALQNFNALTPDVILDAVEAALGVQLSSLTHPLNSYINRVYELAARDGTRLIAKFYRPGRWRRAAVMDEHRFVLECVEEEIPVVAPMPLLDGSTIGEAAGILFAVYPKRRGRELEPCSEDDWRRLGRLVARLHLVGCRRAAPARLRLHPATTTAADIRTLQEGGFVPRQSLALFQEVTGALMKRMLPLFADVALLRIHGDCHRGNLLDRPDEGLVIIDFDDMAVGPAIQDLWMLLPDYAEHVRHELNLIAEGYEDFREFDWGSLKLIEPLRAMRMLYYLAWCSQQTTDPTFQQRFPDWGNDAFWRREISALQQQLEVVTASLDGRPAGPSY